MSLIQRRVGIALGCASSLDVALAVEAGELGLRLLPHADGGAERAELFGHARKLAQKRIPLALERVVLGAEHVALGDRGGVFFADGMPSADVDAAATVPHVTASKVFSRCRFQVSGTACRASL